MLVKPQSLVGRTVLAILLLMGFYILAIGIAFVLFYIPYAEVVYVGKLHLQIAIGCIIGGIIILWSIIPRFDRFMSPGPLLKPEDHPRLFNELFDIANKVNQKMPVEVYLVEDVNAWVSQRGGIMGIGSRRVMGLGLPILQVLSVSEFRAVLVHEFGHFYGGDTKLGPWIYKTRAAICRTLQGLAGQDTLQKPFVWYGNMFLRITHAISRRQEYISDELAARIVGSRPFASGLRTIHLAGMAYHSYWNTELAPVLEAGLRPPYAKGFLGFLEAKSIKEKISEALEKEIEKDEEDPYNTHPPLRERLAAIQSLPQGPVLKEDPLAITLLDNESGLEADLFALLGGERGEKLQPILWDNIGEQVYLPKWEKLVQSHQEDLSDITTHSIPKFLGSMEEFSRKLKGTAKQMLDNEETIQYATTVLGAAFVLILVKQGWTLYAYPGEPFLVKLEDKAIEPFEMVKQLLTKDLTEEEWQSKCMEFKIPDLNFRDVLKEIIE